MPTGKLYSTKNDQQDGSIYTGWSGVKVGVIVLAFLGSCSFGVTKCAQYVSKDPVEFRGEYRGLHYEINSEQKSIRLSEYSYTSPGERDHYASYTLGADEAHHSLWSDCTPYVLKELSNKDSLTSLYNKVIIEKQGDVNE